MPVVPNKISKQGDTGEFVRGQASDANGPVDLRGLPCRFLGKATVGGVPILIDSDAGDGVVVVEEDVSGNVADRGWWHFEPTNTGVDTSGLFEVELKVTVDAGPPVKTLTWPSAAAANPHWQIDPSLA